MKIEWGVATARKYNRLELHWNRLHDASQDKCDKNGPQQHIGTYSMFKKIRLLTSRVD